MRRRMRVGGLAMVLMGCSMHSIAQHNPSGTPAEQAQLPSFCAVKLKDSNTSPDAQRLIAQFGFDNWLHLHHYCYGKVFLIRASKAVEKREANYQRSLAIKEMSYVLNAAKPDFWMRPQISLEVGRIHQSLGEKDKAILRFGEAIRSGRTYLPAYLALIAALRGNDQRGDALAVAEEGLRNLPDSAELKKAYFELGGKEPLPKPLGVITRDTPDVDNGGRAAGDGGAGSTVVKEPMVPPQGNESITPDRREAGEGPSSESAQVDGKSCRFCPPAEIENRWRESFQR